MVPVLTDGLVLGVASTWLKPLWVVGVGVVAALASLYILALWLGQILPTTTAIARTTAKEAMSQPLFYV